MGLEFESNFFGLGKEPIKVYTYPISIFMHDREEKIVVRWIKHDMDSRTDFPVVLGQDSIFMYFDIHFSRRQKKFFLNKDILNQ